MKYLALLCILTFGSSGLVSAAEEVDCSALENAEDRLACFDARFPKETPVESSAADPVDVAPVIISTSVIAVEAQETSAPEPAPAPPATADQPAETGFLGDVKVDLSSTIRAIRAGEKQKMVFLLDNEQIWMQTSPRPLPFEKGDAVTVKNATLGGYFLRSEKGASTRVQRIQ